MGYKNFYLYSAANPETGDSFTLLMPKVNVTCMNIFLQELSKVNKGKKLVLIMDGASWHKSDKLNIPKNIRIIIQPSYSPELNPIEKLWQYIKDHTIKNRIFYTLSDLENNVCRFINTLNKQTIQSVCHVNYL